LTPHNSGITDQAQVALATNVAQGILDVLSGKRPARVVNPEAFDKPRM
jgi:phosphoglycerate dehydrogenase-like enzyme